MNALFGLCDCDTDEDDGTAEGFVPTEGFSQKEPGEDDGEEGDEIDV